MKNQFIKNQNFKVNLFKNKKILIIGDVMLDSYLFGNVERISPEAPVPIVDFVIKQNKLGGAANVAANIKNLGGVPLLCSVIGKDQKGDIFLLLLKKQGISSDLILQSECRITTDKTRIIGNNHQMLRIDEEIKSDLSDELRKIFLDFIDSIFDDMKIDCVLFQDYDKGILNEIIISSIINKAKTLDIPIVVDPKKNNFSFYKNVTLFKPNLKEFREGMNLSNVGLELLEVGSRILHGRGIEIIFITLSENGIFVSYKKDDRIINKIIPGISREVVDVSGAGDTVVAVAAMLLNDIDIEEIAKIANMSGGIVCEEIGVVPIDKDKLLKEYYETDN